MSDDRARFGDLLRAAADQLDATGGGPPRATTSVDIQNTARGLLRMVRAMSRCVAATDVSGRSMVLARAREPSTWMRARREALQALDNAARFVRPHAASRRDVRETAKVDRVIAGGPARRLDSAALALQAGQDLLQTHFDQRPGGICDRRSRWAPAIDSEPFTAAMLAELAKLAHRSAAQASGVALAPGPPGSWSARRDLNTSSQWLWVFVNTVKSAQREEPVLASMRDLLRHIPANVMPGRRVPVGRETVIDLCDGAISTAERLRHLASALTREAKWSPAMTITSLSRTTRAATVTSHNCEVLLTTLADCDSATSLRQQLLAGAAAAGQARDSWLASAYALDDITTDTRGHLSPAAVETNDLALWTGRLAYANPNWNPAAGPRHPARSPTALVASPDDLKKVVDAVHYTCDTLSSLARANHDQIRAAARASRILVPTRTMPGTIDVPFAFTAAPGPRVAGVLARYREAAIASRQTTTEIAAAADAVSASSRVLTTARVASDAGHNPLPRPVTQASAAAPERCEDVPGPVEGVLRQLGITDNQFLEKAAVLDRDGAHLVIDAAATLDPRAAKAAAAEARRSLDGAPVISHAFAVGAIQPAAFMQPTPPAEREAQR